MAIALTLLVSIPIALALALLVARRVTRRDLARTDGVFRCKVRVEAGVVPGLGRQYDRRWRLGGWTHDVLLLRRTWAVPRLVPYPVGSADQLATVTDRSHLMSLRLHLDSGAVIRVVADRTARARLVGPFLMTEIERLDTGLMRGQT